MRMVKDDDDNDANSLSHQGTSIPCVGGSHAPSPATSPQEQKSQIRICKCVLHRMSEYANLTHKEYADVEFAKCFTPSRSPFFLNFTQEKHVSRDIFGKK